MIERPPQGGLRVIGLVNADNDAVQSITISHAPHAR
jgi:hypothetical protein